MSEIRRKLLININNNETNYVTDRLIAQFDGINNIGTNHDSSARTWADLTGNGFDLSFYGSQFSNNFSWAEDHLVFTGTGTLNQYFYSANNLYSPTNNFTVECCYKIVNQPNTNYSTYAMSLQYTPGSDDVYQLNVFFGRSSSSTYYRYLVGCTQWYESLQASSSHPSINLNESVTTTLIKPYHYFYNNGTLNLVTYKNGGNKFNNYQCNYYSNYSSGYPGRLRFYVPRYPNTDNLQYTAYIYAIRLYDKQLSDSEVLQNALEDQKRFKF